MRNPVFSFSMLFVLLLLLSCQEPEKNVSSELTPESLGIPSRAVLDFINAIEDFHEDELHGFVLMKNGETAAEGWWAPYGPSHPHMMFSLSKSFTSTAIGLAQEEGLLNIYDPVIKFFPEYTPEEPSGNLMNMRIKDLLRMSTGHDRDSWIRIQDDEGPWVKNYLALPVEHKPGTHFQYNTGATFILSAIIQKVSGENLQDYLQPRLFKPLSIENPAWDKNPDGIDKGGTGLYIRTRDIARFGQMLLQQGEWNDKQIVPRAWVMEATALQTSNGSNPESDWDQGYGYQFWRCKPENVYRGDGAFGQYCIVMPDQNAVLAITSGTKDMQAILNLVWKHLLSAMQTEPLLEDTVSYNELVSKLKNLSLPKVEGNISSPLAENVSDKTFQMEQNSDGLEWIKPRFGEEVNEIIYGYSNQEYIISLAQQNFTYSQLPFPKTGRQPVACHGAWLDEHTFHLRLYLYETPFYEDHKFYFEDKRVMIEKKINVSFNTDKERKMIGYIKDF